MRSNRLRLAARAPRARQEGVVLMIALIVLVAMTLAGIGIIRSIDTATMVANNIGFRQIAVASGDAGIEAARIWLINNSTTLDTRTTRMSETEMPCSVWLKRAAAGTDRGRRTSAIAATDSHPTAMYSPHNLWSSVNAAMYRACETPVPRWKHSDWANDVLPDADPAHDPSREVLWKG